MTGKLNFVTGWLRRPLCPLEEAQINSSTTRAPRRIFCCGRTEAPLPEIKWDEANPGFNASALDEDEKKVRDRFSLPEVNCLGADTHCGCGFRHALLDGKDWFPIISENEKDINDEKKNHQDLFDYIISNVKKGRVELFGCWNGDGHEEPLSVTEITYLNLLDDNFYFKERGFYYFVIR